VASLPGRPCEQLHSLFLDTSRRGIGKSQSRWTDAKMETPVVPGRPCEQLHWLLPTHGNCTSVEQSARSLDLGSWEIMRSSHTQHTHLGAPARPFPSSIVLDTNRRDIGKSQSRWTIPRWKRPAHEGRSPRWPGRRRRTRPSCTRCLGRQPAHAVARVRQHVSHASHVIVSRWVLPRGTATQ
jgi:hypothetical protein